MPSRGSRVVESRATGMDDQDRSTAVSPRRRRRHRSHRRSAPGTPPGTLTADPDAPAPVIHVMAYGPEQYTERELTDPQSVTDFLGKWPVTWMNVYGLGNTTVLAEIGKLFELHPLALEDVVNRHQRAKVEQYGPNQFIVAHMVTLGEHVDTEQLSLFLGPNFVLTFEERPGDCLDSVRERIRTGTGRLRTTGPDYLAYALLDTVIDAYFPVLEHYGERLETLEDDVIRQPDNDTLGRVHAVKQDLLTLRRMIWPLRDAINSLMRETDSLITKETRLYLRDCYDHVIRVIDLLETYREVGSGLMDVYLSSVSNRMNEVMKVLTIIATIFIPLSFIAGLYGMNFSHDRSPWNMPELSWYFGYPFALLLMAIVAGGLLLFFRHRGWLGASPTPSKGTAGRNAVAP
jgi:magnesium transporter